MTILGKVTCQLITRSQYVSFGRLAVLGLLLAFGMALPFDGSQAGMNDGFAGIATLVPEFAGIHVDDEQDTIYLHMRNGNAAAAQAVVTELRSLFGSQHLRHSKIRVLPATFAFPKLKRWHDDIVRDVLVQPGVVFTGISHSQNRVVIGMENSKVRSVVEEQLNKLGVPREAVSLMETGPVKFLQGIHDPSSPTLRDRHRPLVGGLEIGTPPDGKGGDCTIGFIAKRFNILGFVTASHCGSEIGHVDTSDRYAQPTAGDIVGFEEFEPGFQACHCLFFGRVCLNQCRRSDSTFVRLDGQRDGIDAVVGEIARVPITVGVCCSVDWDGESTYHITGGATLFEFQQVTKVGRTTGGTDGHVVLGAVTINVDFPSTPSPVSGVIPFTKLLTDQVMTTVFSEEGDSGGPFLHENSLVGILWGSSTLGFSFYAPISNVQDELGPLTFVANTNPKPDLVATPEQLAFCNPTGPNGSRQLLIRVSNIGGAVATASETRIDFFAFGNQSQTVRTLRPGQSMLLHPVDVPVDCTSVSSCPFSITVDYDSGRVGGDIDEGVAGEQNNTVSSACVQ
jgi:hypothetical protein